MLNEGLAMKILTLLGLFYSSNLLAVIVSPNDYNSQRHLKESQAVISSFYEELYQQTKDLKPQEEVKKVVRSSPNAGRRGKLIIEQMKQRNREKLAAMRGYDASKVKSGKDLIKMQKDDNKQLIKKINEERKKLEDKYADLPLEKRRSMVWQELAKSEMDDLKKKVLKEHRAWREKHKKIYQKWLEDKKKYNTEVDDYKKTLINIPLVLPVSKKEAKKKVQFEIAKEYQLVSSAMDPSIRDQQFRATCSSFAGVRAIEILLAQNQKSKDLSEQYFYWASKPNCQNRKCNKKGSWVGNGFKYSKEQNIMDIPLEKDCSYNPISMNFNETQIPLKSGCSKGAVKVSQFDYLNNLDQVVTALKLNKPVIASIKLSPNFYKNKGLILKKDKNNGANMNSHASGHAVLLVGYLKLPRVLNEGKLCFITANSWGQGWGNGGYACLSEEWLVEHRNRNPFVTVSNAYL
ncbi:MAG: hypothetical protein OEW87_14585 [Flavobacteriaceae bacterium]|nr:hypothetical protein [Flavobacteriaceae bacterium]